MMMKEILIPSFLFYKDTRVVQTGAREGGAHDYVAAFMYNKQNDSFILDKENTQKYHTFPGGQIESTDRSLLGGMLRELAEELPVGCVPHLNENGPLATIACQKTEWTPKQMIHIFTGVVDLTPFCMPYLPAWVLRESTEYIANQELARVIRNIIDTQFPTITRPSTIGFSPSVIVQYPKPLLAQITTVNDYH